MKNRIIMVIAAFALGGCAVHNNGHPHHGHKSGSHQHTHHGHQSSSHEHDADHEHK